MVVKFYVDLKSQPCRSIFMFLKLSKIDYEMVPLSLFKGEHKKPELASTINLGSLPAIKEDSFCLSECVAIFRYLATKYSNKCPGNLYPADTRVRAKVDEYMSYHHTGIRSKLVALVVGEVLSPMFGAPKPTKEKLDELVKGVDDALEKFEQNFLGDKDFIVGKEMSFADILVLNEIAQLSLCPHDFAKKHPKVHTYFERVKAKLGPLYDEACVDLNDWKASLQSK